MSKETQPGSLKDKVIWYAKYGGIVAGLIGLVIASAELAVAGGVVTAAGFVFDQKNS